MRMHICFLNCLAMIETHTCIGSKYLAFLHCGCTLSLGEGQYFHLIWQQVPRVVVTGGHREESQYFLEYKYFYLKIWADIYECLFENIQSVDGCKNI